MDKAGAAQGHTPAAQALHRQSVIDFGGLRVVDGKRLHVGQGQFLAQARQRQFRKAGAFGKVFVHKALPMELISVANRPGLQQEGQGGGVAVARGLHYGLVFGAVFVGFKEDFVELCAHRFGANPRNQFDCPRVDLRLDLLLFFDGQEGLGQDVGGGFFEAPFAQSTKVVGSRLQTQQSSRLLHSAWRIVKVPAGQCRKIELVLGGKFVGQRQFHRRLQRHGLGHHGAGLGFVKTQPSVGAFDLDPFARIQLNLQGVVGFGQDSTGHGLTGIVKQ